MKVNVTLRNAKEFQKLLNRAATLTEQLNETLQQINNFKLDIHAETEKEECTEKIIEQIFKRLEKATLSL